MTLFHRSALARAGAVALLAAGGLTTVAVPAQAADGPDLALIPISTRAREGCRRGPEQAASSPSPTRHGHGGGRSLRVNTQQLKEKRVGFLVPEGCRAIESHLYQCSLGDLPAGTSKDFGVPLFSTGGRGDGGKLVVHVVTATPGARFATRSSCR